MLTSIDWVIVLKMKFGWPNFIGWIHGWCDTFDSPIHENALVPALIRDFVNLLHGQSH